MEEKKRPLNAVEKALLILMAFYPRNSEMGTVDLSRKTGFHIATVNRILRILARNRFLFQNPLTRKFNLGPSVFALGEAAIESLNDNLLHKALPYLNELCEKVRETVVLEVISGESGIVAYVAQGKQTIGIRANIGSRLPTHAAAGAKAIIAFSSEERAGNFFKKNLRRFTPKTITDPEKLRRHLQKIRRQGVSFCQEEIDVGVNAIGVPIFNHKHQPVAAIVVVGPSQRVRCNAKSPMVAEIHKTASMIAVQLFHRESSGKNSYAGLAIA
ncbi:MAG TPA: IclR family transcriptional regulator [Thermodesulfobacteriota bacterium]|nr:IclR family transcriptional regulator [Thermodesulfobacteriota bacterium]